MTIRKILLVQVFTHTQHTTHTQHMAQLTVSKACCVVSSEEAACGKSNMTERNRSIPSPQIQPGK